MECFRGFKLKAPSVPARSVGFPLDFFPVLFVVPRVVGWLAHWRQMMLQEGGVKIWRPRQVRVGSIIVFPVPGLLIHSRLPGDCPITVAMVY